MARAKVEGGCLRAGVEEREGGGGAPRKWERREGEGKAWRDARWRPVIPGTLLAAIGLAVEPTAASRPSRHVGYVPR